MVCRYLKDLISPDAKIHDLIHRFRRFPKFKSFIGLEHFDFEGASAKALLIFFEFVGRRSFSERQQASKLRQLLPPSYHMLPWYSDLQFTLFHLCTNNVADFGRIRRCTITEDYIKFFPSKCPNLRELVLYDDKKKRADLADNYELFLEDNNTNRRRFAFGGEPEDDALREHSHKVDWKLYPYDSDTLILDLSKFPNLEKLRIRESKLQIIQNFDSNQLHDLRLENVDLDYESVKSSTLQKLKTFHFLDSNLYSDLEGEKNRWESDPNGTLFKSFVRNNCGEGLEKLKMKRYDHPPDFLIRSCPNIRVLKISRVGKYQARDDLSRKKKVENYDYYTSFLFGLRRLEKLWLDLEETSEGCTISMENVVGLWKKKNNNQQQQQQLKLKRLRLKFHSDVDAFFETLSYISSSSSLEELFVHHDWKIMKKELFTHHGSKFFFHDLILSQKNLKSLYIKRTKEYQHDIPLEFTKQISKHENLQCVMIYHSKRDEELDLYHLKNLLGLPRLTALHSTFDFSKKVLKKYDVTMKKVGKWILEAPNLRVFSACNFGDLSYSRKKGIMKHLLDDRCGIKRVIFGMNMLYDNNDVSIVEFRRNEAGKRTFEVLPKVRIMKKYFTRHSFF